MAIILFTGEDFAAINSIGRLVEGMGHTVMHAVTTENIVEDVVLNDVALVIASENTRPFNEWEVCRMLRADPTVPRELAIVLMHTGDVNRRRFSESEFTGKMDSDAAAALWSEEIVRQLGERAGPETTDPLAHSGFE